MEGKRPGDEIDGDTKRVKTGYEVTLGGEQYIILEQLVLTPPFTTYYKKNGKSVKQLVARENLGEEVIAVSKANVKNKILDIRTTYKPATDLRLAKKWGNMKAFLDRIMGATPTSHPLITDEDIRFFKDALEQDHKVEMRGERTLRGIFFKVEDVGQAIGTATLCADITREKAKAQEGEDYVWLSVDHKRVLFVTFIGLMRVIMRSNLPGAKPLCLWVCEKVFCIGFGTAEQKQELGRSLLDKKMIDELTKRCGHDIACVYLLETTREPGDSKKVYKFGYTKNLQERMGKLIREHGRDSVIDTLLLLPEARLSSMEAEMKQVLGDTYRYEEGTQTELLALSEDECKAVRVTMRSIGKSFYGSTLVHQHQVHMIKKDHEIELVSTTKDLQLLLERAQTDAKLAKKDNEILEIKNRVQAQRIQELEEMFRRMSSKAP